MELWVETIIFGTEHLCVQYLELYVEQTDCCCMKAVLLSHKTLFESAEISRLFHPAYCYIISMHCYIMFLLLHFLEII